jgi:serine/threonine protein phosphatase PrpC
LKYCLADLEAPLKQELLGGQLFLYTHRSPDKETVNEDCVAVLPYNEDKAVLVVADGLGGLPGGSGAAQIAVSTIEKAFSQQDKDINLRNLILNCFEKANQHILEKAMGSATTLAVVELQNDELRTYHVGDSKIVVCGQRGKIKVNTVSHSPVEYAVEAGMLDENEAVLHEERHLVSNVVGSNEMSITVGPTITLAKYDTVLIASDGLFDNLFIDEIIDIIRKGTLEKAAGQLVKLANERMDSEEAGMPGHADDLSFILYRQA